MRLDQVVTALTALSRRRARALIGEGRVSVDGRPVKVQSRAVEMAQVLELEPDAFDPGYPDATTPPEIEILWEDPWVLAVHKPAGILSQPAERRRHGELAMDERVRLALAWRQGRRPDLYLLHRLDRGASGLLLFACSAAAASTLSEAFYRGRVERRYRAVVEGRPGFHHRRVEAPIARVRGGAWRFEVAERGRPAVTEVAVERLGEGWAVVRCRLVTGRTHQVRVHLAHLGHPVLGDRLYGSGEGAAVRPLLHAEELTFPHPEDGRPVTVTDPPPPDFRPYPDSGGAGA